MKKILLFLTLLLSLMLVGCAGQNEDKNNIIPVYFLNSSETRIEPHDCVVDLENFEEKTDSEKTVKQQQMESKVGKLLLALSTNPQKFEYKAPLAMGFNVLDYTVVSGKVQINVDAGYYNLSATSEVLVRAAIVRTLTQLPEINFVSILVEGTQLLYNSGEVIGWMSRDQFIENEGNEINNYQEVKIKLYFANESGDGLIVASRTKEYNTNVSLEKLIVEELIKGPTLEGLYPTINPATRVASVTVKDGVCYVNLDESFLNQPYNVSADATIYSLTNSLTELSNVDQVQISVNGDNSSIYREKYSLTTYFERNLDLVINLEK